MRYSFFQHKPQHEKPAKTEKQYAKPSKNTTFIWKLDKTFNTKGYKSKAHCNDQAVLPKGVINPDFFHDTSVRLPLIYYYSPFLIFCFYI